jgi:hypothetical protein
LIACAPFAQGCARSAQFSIRKSRRKNSPQIIKPKMSVKLAASMRVLLIDEETRRYYAGEELWVADVTAAVDFGAIERAGQKALECGSKLLNVILRYDNPFCEVALNPAFCIPRTKTRASLPQF